MQLGERGDADRAFKVAWALRSDENRGVEQRSHLRCEKVIQAAGEPGQVIGERLRGRGLPDLLKRGSPHPLTGSCGAEPRHRPTCDRHGEFLAGFGTPQDIADVVA